MSTKAKILFVVVLLASVSAGIIWRLQNPPGVIMINPMRPPQNILGEAELEKLRALQNTTDIFLIGSISPDDSTVIVATGTEEGSENEGSKQVSWMNIQTGQLEPVDSKFLELFPQGEIAWPDNNTAVYLSSNLNGDPVLVTLQRSTDEMQTKPLEISGRPLSLAPNGSRLLIESGSENKIDLSIMDVASGATEKLLSYHGTTPLSIAWTPDGSKLAIIHLVLPGDKVDEKWGLEISHQDATGNVPLDQNPFYAGNVVDIFDFQQGVSHLEALNAGEDGDGYYFNKVFWSPDGRRLLAKMLRPSQPKGRSNPVVLLGQFADRANYRVYDADLHWIETLDQPELEAPNSALSPVAGDAMFVSADEVVIVAAYGLNMHLFYSNLATGEFRRLPTEPGTFDMAPGGYQVYFTHQSRQVLYTQSSFQHPSEIHRLDLDGGAPQLLLKYNDSAVAANQIRVDEVRFELSEDIVRVGYLLQPAGGTFPPQNIPIVIYHQGGPGGAMTNHWGKSPDDPWNLLPNFGIGLLFMPFSGREGFGPEFYRALADADNFGQIDVAESALAARYLIEHGYSARGQIGIAGCSYGGYVVNQSLIQYPELYAAGNAQCSIVDIAAWWEDNPLMVDFYQGARPAQKPDEYRWDSPMHNAAQINTPLLLFHGVDDNLLPFRLVKQFRTEVESAGVPVRFLAFKSEGHGLSFPSSQLIAAQEQIVWFREYLGIQPSQ
ncbi:MAG TPA: prolyl oligopeptidase family serine peptidase [Anaerolineales bacterium]|nr:prolyl oligopeptidase family serine peptidase [Anaerolineales bacterium]